MQFYEDIIQKVAALAVASRRSPGKALSTIRREYSDHFEVAFVDFVKN